MAILKVRKPQVSTHRCPIVPGSISEVVINYLYMRARSTKGPYATRQEIYELAPLKFNKIDNLQRALDRLENMGLVITKKFSNGIIQWAITADGLDIPNQVANIRRQNPKHKSDTEDF